MNLENIHTADPPSPRPRPKTAWNCLGRAPNCRTSCQNSSLGVYRHNAKNGTEIGALGPKISRFFLENFFTGVARW